MSAERSIVFDADSARRALARRCAEVAFEHYQLGQRFVVLRSVIATLAMDPTYASRRGLLSIAVRSILGPRAVDFFNAILKKGHRPSVVAVEQEKLSRVSEKPTDPGCHQELGLYFLAQGNLFRAYACLRTASTLAHLQGFADSRIQEILRSIEDQFHLSPETQPSIQLSQLAAQGDPYARLQFLAKQAALCVGHQPLRVLDVGGGDGFLAVLLPNTDYVLVEPLVNGLDAHNLPFAERAFDVVIASHVLEHVAKNDRRQFVEELMRVSNNLVLILAPFLPAEGRPLTEQSIWTTTRTIWAYEHLEHGLPSLDDIRTDLEGSAVRYDIVPNADARVMYWQFLATHFAALAGENQAIQSATEFYQQYFDYRPADPLEPHDFLVRIWMPERGD